MEVHTLIKDHGNYKKGEAIKLHPSTARILMLHGVIADPNKKKGRPKSSE